MDDRPALYLAHPSARAAAGPGVRYTIMRSPPKGTAGAGEVSLLVPPIGPLQAFRSGRLPEHEFVRTLRTLWGTPASLAPGRLWASTAGGIVPVRTGDTLTCTCAVGAFCHRRVAAPILRDAGWDVWLDGVRLEET